MTVWFTSDTHFGHKRIIELAKRPFKDLPEMDLEMICRWNSKVGPKDWVYHLGDFAFSAPDYYLSQLNGQFKFLIKGNHDNHKNRLSNGWDHVYKSYHETEIDGQFLVLCHYGLRVWNKSHYGAIHLYGHSHGNLPGDSQSMDVGVDCTDFYPVNLDDIRARLATQPKRMEPDHHKRSDVSKVAAA